MIRPKVVLVIVLAFLAGGGSVAARPFQEHTSDELVALADVVCNGIPVKIDITDEKAERKCGAGEGNSTPMRMVIATIQVVGTAKGKTLSEIRLRYPILDSRAFPRGIINGPAQIDLELHKRYRFFLKAPDNASGAYVGVLDGSFDDGGAVELLDDDESNENAPLMQARAEEIASAYLKRLRPEYSINRDWIVFSYVSRRNGSHWEVAFCSKPPYTYPAFTGDAEIMVHSTGVVDSNSWVATGFPQTPQDDLRTIIRKEVRITMRKVKSPAGGEIFILRGVVDHISTNGVMGIFSDYQQREPPASMSIPFELLQTIQELVPTNTSSRAK